MQIAFVDDPVIESTHEFGKPLKYNYYHLRAIRNLITHFQYTRVAADTLFRDTITTMTFLDLSKNEKFFPNDGY